MGEKRSGLNLFRKVPEVLVIPGRVYIAKQAGLVVMLVPADAKPVAIGDRVAFAGL